MKKIVSLILGVLCIFGANAAQIANIEYVHKMIEHKWDITVPYNPALTDVKTIANMKYLLTAVDVANEILNGEKTTDYGNGEFATLQAADTVATNQAVETLVRKNVPYKFRATVGCSTSTCGFSFSLSAQGTFYLDWGDGTTEIIEKTDTTAQEFSHDYTAGEYSFRFGGLATAYDPYHTCSYSRCSTFRFCDPDTQCVGEIYEIFGCLGCIFPTMTNGLQPVFEVLFLNQHSLTGEVPANFFAGIHGTVEKNMFTSAFSATGISSIGSPLFDDLSAGFNIPGSNRGFDGMFKNCVNLTGESAKMRLSDGSIKFLYEVYPDATYQQVGACYYGDTGLSDYDNMPRNWTYWDI